LIEWLASPIVYVERPEAIAPVRALVETTLLPESLCHHYLAQTRRLMATIEQGPEGKLKSYFYVMRALLAARWVIERGTSPPMEIWQLLDDGPPLFCSRTRLEELAAQKAESVEGGAVERLADLETALRSEHDRLAALIPKNGPPSDPAIFDDAFLAVLRATGRLAGGPSPGAR
ncbi:MAG: nucleotidyltransferase domain-containing protein, partial [Acidobacteriota bacterium]